VKLVTYEAGGRVSIGLYQRGIIYDLDGSYVSVFGERGGFPKDMLSLIEGGDDTLERARQLDKSLVEWGGRLKAAGVTYGEAEVHLLAPIPRPRKNIVCLGVNYAEHAEETGHELPRFPVFFTKPPTVVIGPYDPIRLPTCSWQIDYEAELAFVFGRKGRNIGPENALDYVAGYMVMDDVTARDLQSNHQQWFKGKGLDTFGPMGPYFVTKEEVPNPHGLRLRTWLNGEVMQDSSTMNMIFKIPALVSCLSMDMTVEPGDIVSTGTPSGIGHSRSPPVYLKAGDLVEVEVEGVGVLRNKVTSTRGQ
jgi:2-keto-4-pentenoate hydratase/2-oxohepta-3-ene-1,7-dioic acid hydratase in catechol pathway